MTLEEFREILRRDEAFDRERLNEVLGSQPDRPTTVGKHEAKSWVHLRAVIAEADDACPRAADTIRWLLWHDLLSQQRIRLMSEDIEISDRAEPEV